MQKILVRISLQSVLDERDEDLDEDDIADYITEHFEGNSLIAAGDEDLVKIDFHTNEPWKILEYCNSVEVFDIVVEDMIRGRWTAGITKKALKEDYLLKLGVSERQRSRKCNAERDRSSDRARRMYAGWPKAWAVRKFREKRFPMNGARQYPMKNTGN